VASTQRRSNPLALAVLALLGERPMHPYEMGALLRERHKELSIKLNYGTLYSVIEALQRQDLIRPQETVREGRRPERTVYALTAAGHVELLSWLRELLRTPVKEYPQFRAGLSFIALLPPAEVTALLDERVAHLAQTAKHLRDLIDVATQDGVGRVFLIEAEHELVLLEAELGWVRGLRQSIADGTLSGMQEWLEHHAQRESRGEDAARSSNPARQGSPERP
jgi:DNA-binding PadR family transcriptional regulator